MCNLGQIDAVYVPVRQMLHCALPSLSEYSKGIQTSDKLPRQNFSINVSQTICAICEVPIKANMQYKYAAPSAQATLPDGLW